MTVPDEPLDPLSEELVAAFPLGDRRLVLTQFSSGDYQRETLVGQCVACGALVPVERFELHRAWHLTLTGAVSFAMSAATGRYA